MNAKNDGTEKSSFVDMALRLAAIIGLIAVLIFGAWGIIQIAFNLPGILSGITGRVGNVVTPSFGRETLSIDTPDFAVADQPFTLTWEHTNKGDKAYTYTVAYACAEGVSLAVPTQSGRYESVVCNSPFNYIDATSTMPLIATHRSTQQQNITLTVRAISLQDGEEMFNASTTLTVLPARSAGTQNPSTPNTGGPIATPSTGSPQAPTTAPPAGGPTTPVAQGTPDLATAIISATPLAGGMTQLRFEIGNRGTKAVNAGWTFMVKIPYAAGYTFYSQPQQAMSPGDKVVYTMNFQSTEYIPGTYQTGPVSVITDPSNLVRELSESNNTSVANVTLQ